MNIKGKIALITGASRGIGRAIAHELAKNGIRRLILVARSAHQLHQVANDIRCLNVEAIPIALDLTISRDVSVVMAKIWRDYGDIDLLINCAGVAYQTPFLKCRSSQVQAEMSLNMMGMYTVTSAIARRMASRRSGTIVNVSSLMGKIAAPTMATYSATKFAIVGFTRALRMELAPHNVRVMTLLPSLTDTDMAKDMEKFRGVIPMSTEQVAKALTQGLSKDASEVLVGWQSHLAVWCDRISPWLLEQILCLSAPRRVTSTPTT
ncbi:oxidoreductase, short chain dehydrogenase/reductase family [Synechococcus sp. PCC 7335]|uniref:SDR family NAD(P)-dependent oxidoreductase n=1 Tax=Synechococcus sp. (strain ATCC 29403 / PCC 7335) TaxID=91464 RepID=UPI00017EB45D|nr:SDR family NAD(P)-dependent oxidoreductase [Synechococcus sp. PCC 7335]EDX86687.1 oxidoreductase, short chain dehydrogenase/reductase family [Synechococcus sp. PCC 7335]